MIQAIAKDASPAKTTGRRPFRSDRWPNITADTARASMPPRAHASAVVNPVLCRATMAFGRYTNHRLNDDVKAAVRRKPHSRVDRCAHRPRLRVARSSGVELLVTNSGDSSVR